jgi:excisionase family DNA binding protein
VRYNRGQKTGGQQSQVSLSAPKAAEPSTMPFAQRLTCTIDNACEVTGLGRTKLYELIGAGRIVTTTIGRRRPVVVRCWCQGAPEVSVGSSVISTVAPKLAARSSGSTNAALTFPAGMASNPRYIRRCHPSRYYRANFALPAWQREALVPKINDDSLTHKFLPETPPLRPCQATGKTARYLRNART